MFGELSAINIEYNDDKHSLLKMPDVTYHY